jgi:hypothetical protein
LFVAGESLLPIRSDQLCSTTVPVFAMVHRSAELRGGIAKRGALL